MTLLDVARIEAGQLRVERESCSLAQIVTDVVDSLRAGADAKQLTLAADARRGNAAAHRD